MKRARVSLLVATGLIACVGVAHAAPPRFINFQGRMADGSGTPSTGTFNITFRLFNDPTAGTACHDATQTVAMNSGLFNVNIGAPTGISQTCYFEVPYYLEVEVVGSGAAMAPRVPLAAGAYAFRARVAEDSLLLGGNSAGNAAGQVPVSNGTLNATLNAEYVDGKSAAALTPSVPLNVCPQGDVNITFASGCTVYTFTGNTCGTCTGTAPACPAGCSSASHVCEDNGCCQTDKASNCISNWKRMRRTCSCTLQQVGTMAPP